MSLLNFLVLTIPAGAAIALARKVPFALPALAPVFLFTLWQAVSSAHLESGVYSFELFTRTYATGATWRLVTAFAALILCYWIPFHLYKSPRASGSDEGSSGQARLLSPALVAALACAALIVLWYAPSGPVSSRNQFIAETHSPIRDMVFKYLPLLAFGGGISAALSKNIPLTAAAYASALLSVFSMTRFGHKFSGLLDLLFPFSIPVLIMVFRRTGDKRYIRVLLLLLSSLLFFSAALSRTAFSSYLDMRREGWMEMRPRLSGASNLEVTLNYIKDRVFVLQGGLWWATDRNIITRGERYGLDAMLDYAGKMTDKSLAPSNAFITEKAIGKEKTEYLLERYTQYTAAAPAVFYAMAGPAGPVLMYSLSGLILGLASLYICRKIFQAHILRALIAFTLFIPVQNFILAGEPGRLSPRNLAVKALLLLVLELAARGLRRKAEPS